MRSETIRLLNCVQIILEFLILIGYAIGLIPFLYLWSGNWVITFTLINVILAYFSQNRTLPFTLVNVFLAFFSYIPIIGYITRFAGIVISAINIAAVRRLV